MAPSGALRRIIALGLISRLRLRSRANLPQEGGKIEVNLSCRNLSCCEIVFTEGAVWNRNLLARCLDIREGALMLAVNAPFHGLDSVALTC